MMENEISESVRTAAKVGELGKKTGPIRKPSAVDSRSVQVLILTKLRFVLSCARSRSRSRLTQPPVSPNVMLRMEAMHRSTYAGFPLWRSCAA